jgi:hypothetical protein
MDVKPKHKHYPRTNHKHCLRDDHKGKNKFEWRTRRSGGHKKKEWVMVAKASDIDSSSCYSHRAQLMKVRTDTRARGQARTSIACASPPKAFAKWHIAPQAIRATRMTRTPRKR